MKSAKKLIAKLTKQIKYHSYLYHTLNNPKISDFEFDNMMKKLIILEKKYPKLVLKNSPTNQIGSKTLNIFKSIIHKTPMLSLENIFTKKDFIKFYKKIYKQIKINEKIKFCCEPKIDGLAVNLFYKNGILIKAATRGNGKIGEDITKNILTIKTIPQTLCGNDIPKFIEIRGEVFITHKNFEKINKKSIRNKEKIFSNPRNAASGSLRQINPLISKKRLLSFFCYGFGKITGNKISRDQYSYLRKFKNWGLPISDNIAVYDDIKDILKFYDKMKTSNIGLDIDGIVIKINSIKHQNKLGCTSNFPKWAIAFKFPSQKKITKLINVDFQVGRTGIITPIAILEPVNISGVIIKKSTLHNFKEIKRLNVKINDYVVICRSGNVIPKIISTEKSQISNNNKNIQIPKLCPSCKSILQYNKNKTLIYCTNNLNCIAQKKEKIRHFVSRDAMNIKGFGKNIIDKLVNTGHLNTIVDIFKLDVNTLIKIEKIGLKNSKNIINSINNSKKTTLSRFIYSLGIPEIGVETSKKIANNYNINFFFQKQI